MKFLIELMRKVIVFIVIVIGAMSFSFAQELNALVTINADKVQSSNKQVYKTLQNSLTEFINNTKWTDKNIKPQERINCAFTIIVSEQLGNNFKASLQIQSTRPVFNSNYDTPILNLNDTGFKFKYNEFDPLIFNPTAYESNLIATITFYIYVILGVDADTFALNGGQQELEFAQKIALQAQQGGDTSWENKIGKQNRFTLIDNLLSPKYAPLRSVYYNYHRKGFDLLSDEINKAKNTIANSIITLDKIHNVSIGNQMLRIFLDAKSDEIVKLFSDGRAVSNQSKMVEVLRKVSAMNNEKWLKIK